MKPKLKKIIIAGVVICVAGGVIVAVKKSLDGNGSVDVESVSNLNIGYMDNPLSSSGMVYDEENQAVYADGTKTITQVFVNVGDQVHAGDRLLSYDLTSLNLAVELSRLETDRIANNITLAEHELVQLEQTKPDPEVTPDPTPSPEPTPVVPEAAEKDEDGRYPYVVSLSEAKNAIASQNIEYCLSEGTPDENSVWQAKLPGAEEGKAIWYHRHVTYGDGSEKTTDPVEYQNQKEEDLLEKTGTKDNPYTFRLQENGLVYGKLINEAKKLGDDSALRFEVTDDNGDLLAEWYLKADRFQECEDATAYNISTHSIQETVADDSSDSASDTTVPVQSSGYTAAELARAIRDKKQEIRKLNLDLRKAQLKLQDDQSSLNDGVVYAKRDGIIRKACDPANPPQDGSAFLEVAGGTGLYVTGFVSELLLDKVKVGDTVSAYSWNSGQNYTASVTSIDSYPTSDGYYGGDGNPNVSYYGFEAYIEDSSDLSTGDYLELTIGDSSSSDTQSIWLSQAYIRKDGNSSYVMKDQDGKLVKQTVKTGKTAYGEYVEILDGLDMSDYIAFPYGKNAKEGKRTNVSDDAQGGTYYG